MPIIITGVEIIHSFNALYIFGFSFLAIFSDILNEQCDLPLSLFPPSRELCVPLTLGMFITSLMFLCDNAMIMLSFRSMLSHRTHRVFCGPTTFQALAVFPIEFINRDHPTFSIIIKVLYHINVNLVDHVSKEKKDCTAKSV